MCPRCRRPQPPQKIYSPKVSLIMAQVSRVFVASDLCNNLQTDQCFSLLKKKKATYEMESSNKGQKRQKQDLVKRGWPWMQLVSSWHKRHL